MKTSDLISALPDIHKKYLDNLKHTRQRALEESHRLMYEQCSASARGYIKALENTGII